MKSHKNHVCACVSTKNPAYVILDTKGGTRKAGHERRDSKRALWCTFPRTKRSLRITQSNAFQFGTRSVFPTRGLHCDRLSTRHRVMATRYCLFTRKVEGTLTCLRLWNKVTISFTTHGKIEMNTIILDRVFLNVFEDGLFQR